MTAPGHGDDREPSCDQLGRGRRPDHAHGDEHGHAHGSRLTLTGEHSRSLLAVMLITLTVAVAQAVGAWISGALVLLADAAHMAADAAGVGLSLLAVYFATRPATLQRHFCYARGEILAALLFGALILPRTWRLLADAINVLLEASPRGIDLSEIRTHLTGLTGVRDVHDLHVWTITSGLPVLSVHIVVEPDVLADGRSAVMLDVLQDCLRGHFDVEHSTFQLEPAGHADHERPMHQ